MHTPLYPAKAAHGGSEAELSEVLSRLQAFSYMGSTLRLFLCGNCLPTVVSKTDMGFVLNSGYLCMGASGDM